MPVELNDDGTVTCTPPWGFSELLDLIGYDCDWDYYYDENALIVFHKYDSLNER